MQLKPPLSLHIGRVNGILVDGFHFMVELYDGSQVSPSHNHPFINSYNLGVSPTSRDILHF